ncbi:MAG: truB, partial [Thermoleophilia bacterium]|nr:truB [Thermoleophilia bacterium]
VATDPSPRAWGPRIVLDVRCGTGTYMRALARDLGELVGQHAFCEALRRTEVGSFTLGRSHEPDAVTWSDVRDAATLIDEAVPRLTIDAAAIDQVGLGARLPFPADRPELAGAPHLALVDADGSFVAMAEPTTDGTLLQPRSVFVDPPAPRVE